MTKARNKKRQLIEQTEKEAERIIQAFDPLLDSLNFAMGELPKSYRLTRDPRLISRLQMVAQTVNQTVDELLRIMQEQDAGN
jgi:hypothetical protein